MKFSKRWLLQHLDAEIDTSDLIARLTMAGLEVDGVEAAAGEFTGVVVGEIESVESHPDADALRICQVRGGGAIQQVVCGAPNAARGLKVPFAQVGAQLPEDVTIAAVKLRGVASFGMLCSAAELGLCTDNEGLMELDPALPSGTDLRQALALDDDIVEVDLTPNRGDCLSIRGLARETAVVTGIALREFPIEPVAATVGDTLPIKLQAGDACPRYAGRIVRGIDPAARTPQWLRERLRRAGVRAIHPVVDITNYVMLELGQPMHGFDLSRIQGGIQVRAARPGETLQLLDGTEMALDEETWVIADDLRPLALAGIMGGSDSGVDESTRDVFLESAHFSPLAIAGKARQFGLHTDASHRFERGVDPALPQLALERATALLLEIAGGQAGPLQVVEAGEALPIPAEISLRLDRLASLLGTEISAARTREILLSLGLEQLEETAEGWMFRVPTWRFDLGIEADLIEEVARIYGYNELPSIMPALAPELSAPPADPARILRAALVHRGYREAITYSFVPADMVAAVSGADSGVPVANPISAAMSVMRPSLWPGLLLAARHNLNRQAGRLRLFEIGLRFDAGPGFGQRQTLAGLATGDRDPESWADPRQRVDFFAIKGDLEALLETLGIAALVTAEQAAHPALHPGQSLRLSGPHGTCLGYAGALHPAVARELGLDQALFLFELFIDRLPEAETRDFCVPSRFPAVRRDIAVIVSREVLAADLLTAVRRAAGPSLSEVRIFDVYQGEGLENNKKSVAIGLTFQDDRRTLRDSDVQAAEDAVVASLVAEFGAKLRGG